MKRLLTFLLVALASVAAFATPNFQVRGNHVLDMKTFKPVYWHGVNNVHWDQAAVKPIILSGSNVVRIVMDFSRAPASNLALTKGYTDAGLATIVGNWGGTCKSDQASLAAIVDTWVAQASTWGDSPVIVNIANEWGPQSTTSVAVPYKANVLVPNYGWRDGYILAIKRMRAAGYKGMLVIDAGNCGQNAETVYRDGAAVLASDPMGNILFDVHVYGGFSLPATVSWQQDYTKAFVALQASGLAIIVGEYGPGLSIGPSPTKISPLQIIATVAARDLVGDIAWGWNDNNMGGCKTSDTGWFGMTNSCSAFTGKSSELTAFGRLMAPMLRQLNHLPALPGLSQP